MADRRGMAAKGTEGRKLTRAQVERLETEWARTTERIERDETRKKAIRSLLADHKKCLEAEVRALNAANEATLARDLAAINVCLADEACVAAVGAALELADPPAPERSDAPAAAAKPPKPPTPEPEAPTPTSESRGVRKKGAKKAAKKAGADKKPVAGRRAKAGRR